jgi:dihydropteroate synthase
MGIGFGKTYQQNLRLIANIKSYKIDGLPLLLGTSRKRVIGTSSQQDDPKQRTFGNISADTVAIFGGADIIRIHDVKNEKQGILTAYALKQEYING